METVGSRIRKEREAQGISRPELSKRTGIGYSTIAELERGGMQTSTKLWAIAEALRVSLRWLETGRGPKAPSAPVISSVDETSQLARLDPTIIQETATAFGNAYRSGVRDRPLDLEVREDAEAFARALARNLQIREDMRRHESTGQDEAQGDGQAGSGASDSMGHDGPTPARKAKQRQA